MSKATTTPLSLAAIVVLVVASVCAQKLAAQRSGDSSAPAPQITPQATSQPVVGVGTPGRLAKWAGLTATTSTIADSNISEDKFGNLGIGTEPTGSLLTVGGIVQTTVGFKFADGTLMTSAGLSAVSHDTSLVGIGTSASPLGLATGGVNSLHLGNGAVTAPKLGTTNAAGAGQVLGFNGSSLVWQTPAVGTITGLTAGTGLTGGGASGNVSLGIANGGVNTLQIADNAVTAAKIATGQVVKSFNGSFDNVTLAAGSNISITPSGDTLTIASAGLTSVAHDATLTGMGTTASPLTVVPAEAQIEPVAASAPQFFAGTVPIFSVPSGKRLVIEHASARCFTSLGQRVTQLVITAETQPSSAGSYELIPISTGSSSGFDFFSASQSIKVYASPGTSVLVFAQKSDSGPVGACSFQISGHLVNVP